MIFLAFPYCRPLPKGQWAVAYVCTTNYHKLILMQATAERAMGGGFRRNSDSELKLKNRCTGSTHKLKRSYATNPILWLKTRMRSSKMRTDRLLTASRRIPCISVGGGGSASRRVCYQAGLHPEGPHPGGVCIPGLPTGGIGQTPPWTDKQL